MGHMSWLEEQLLIYGWGTDSYVGLLSDPGPNTGNDLTKVTPMHE